MVPAFREVQFGLNLYPIRKLHTSSPALVKNPILEGARKDYGVHWIVLGALKDLNRSLVLLVEQCGQGLFRGVGFSVNLRVRDSGIEGGLDAYNASEKSKPKPIYSFEVLWGQGDGVQTIRKDSYESRSKHTELSFDREA